VGLEAAAPEEAAPAPAAPAAAPRRAPMARRSGGLAILALALYAAAGAVGTWFVFQPTLASRFAMLQTDPGDPLLTCYFLEHELRVVEHRDHLGTFWSPPFFYPAPHALSYSENLMGMLPVYALLRLRWDPSTSYQLLLIVMCVLDYAAMLLVLRQLGVGPPLATLGAFFFAFSAPRVALLAHVQLFPIFYVPLSLWALWRLLAAPSRGRLALVLLLLYLQLLSVIYVGWFLLLTFGLVVPLLLFWDRDGWRRLAAFCRAAPWFLALAAAAWAAAFYFLLHPYMAAKAELGERSWNEVLPSLPRLGSWLATMPGSKYHALFPDFARGTPGGWEHYLFPGLVPIALGVASALYTLRLSRQERRRQALLVTCWIAALALAVASLVVPRFIVAGLHLGHLVKDDPGVSLWWLVFRWVPGAGAIRAPGRISILIFALAAVAACCGADAAIRRSRLRPAVRAALLAALLLAGVAEQRVDSPPAYEKRYFFDRVAAVRASIPRGCHMLYLTLQPGASYVVTQQVAMWAGLDAQVPVVNGWSGYLPPRYPPWPRTWTVAELRAWTGDDPCIVALP
jgi:hypothetical protein